MPFSIGSATDVPIGTRLMLSTPAATTRSWVPDSTPCAAKWTACWDEPHCRSMVTPGTFSGSPADSHAVRAMSMDCGPIWETQPMMTSSTAAGSTPVRVISSRQHVRGQVGRVHRGQAAVAPADRGPHRANDVSLSHDVLQHVRGAAGPPRGAPAY